jgi:hypothetical protein
MTSNKAGRDQIGFRLREARERRAPEWEQQFSRN